ncbi:MAG: serine/threonine-protein kinase [Polyangiaceae bacterium]
MTPNDDGFESRGALGTFAVLTAMVSAGQTLLGRFLLLEEIGRGGMSTVFKARDLQEGDLCAVKVALPQFSSGVGSWSMSQREAEIGLGLRHPTLLRFRPLPAGRARNVIVTEYVSGPTLASRIGGRPLGETEAIRIARILCEAVEYLHSQRIVHYDVKPNNIILCDDGSLRLIDFGVAHGLEESRLGLAGQAPPVATADYAAPEQIRRRRGQRSVDIYAIGAVLYEMLTGHPPFEGDDPFAVASAREIGDPKAPRALNPQISAEVEEIVLKTLRRRPEDRYPTVTDLRADLEHPAQVRVSGLAAHLIVPTGWRKAVRWARYITLVGIVPVVSLVALFLVLWWRMSRAR